MVFMFGLGKFYALVCESVLINYIGSLDYSLEYGDVSLSRTLNEGMKSIHSFFNDWLERGAIVVHNKYDTSFKLHSIAAENKSYNCIGNKQPCNETQTTKLYM